jgi:hypothetical protein
MHVSDKTPWVDGSLTKGAFQAHHQGRRENPDHIRRRTRPQPPRVVYENWHDLIRPHDTPVALFLASSESRRTR